MKGYCYLLILILLIVSCKSRNNSNVVYAKDQSILYINDSLAAYLNSTLKDWLTYYNINISDFQVEDISKLDIQSLKNESAIYYRKFVDSDTIYLPNVRDYSPSHRYYLNLLEATNVYSGNDGKWYFPGIDVYQQIFLCDRKDSTLMFISFKKLYNFIEAACWIDDADFVLAGLDRSENNTQYFIEVYNLSNEMITTYNLPDSTINEMNKSYLIDINMKSRGIIIK